MYFSAEVDGSSHLWRQRFPDGTAEQLTFGPTEQDGVAVAPDGRSLITYVGLRQSEIWIHDASGDRQISSEGFALRPQLFWDSKHVYYLLKQNSAATAGELRSLDLNSGKTDRPLPGFSVKDYQVSRDERELAFTTSRENGELEIWLAPLDRSSPPQRIAQGGDQAAFGSNGDLIFRRLEENPISSTALKKTGLEESASEAV